MAVRVRISELSKRYGDTVALDRVSLEVEPGELFFLIGPSGCGKTTLLRAIAGFVEPDAGTIDFDGRRINRVPPHLRNAVLVFQGYALWPHLTVAQNVEYGLRLRKLPPAERRRRVAEILDVVQLGELGRRYPAELSGGQQQRVALARAIVVDPDVLLLDEPLSNLDALLRIELRREILRIHRQTGITTIYVTHDQKEALSMARRIAILDRGQLAQIGRPAECYRRPRSRFVARFLGDANFVEGELARRGEDGSLLIATPLGALLVAPQEQDPVAWRRSQEEKPAAAGRAVCCCFRPESLRPAAPADPAPSNRFRARVINSTYLGETLEYDLSAADGQLSLRATMIGAGEPAAPGSEIELTLSPADIVLL